MDYRPSDGEVFHLGFERKPTDLHGTRWEPQVIVELDAAEWNHLVQYPSADQDFIRVTGAQHILAVGPANAGMIAINTEGATYARYAARIR